MHKITKCICFDVSFLEIKNSGLIKIDDIKNVFKCCTKCKLCEQYIKQMLLTGETEFNKKRIR